MLSSRCLRLRAQGGLNSHPVNVEKYGELIIPENGRWDLTRRKVLTKINEY